MSKKRAIIAAKTFILLAAVAFKEKDRFFGNAMAIYYTDVSHICRPTSIYISPSGAFTTGSFGAQAIILTSGGCYFTGLYATSNCSSAHRLHFHGG